MALDIFVQINEYKGPKVRLFKIMTVSLSSIQDFVVIIWNAMLK